MNKLFLSVFFLTIAINSYADCRTVLIGGNGDQKKLSSAIHGAYIFKASSNLHTEFLELRKKLHRELHRELSTGQVAEAVIQVNMADKFCDSKNVTTYAVSLAREIMSRPEILLPEFVIPYRPVENTETDLVQGMFPKLYKKRSEPILNIGLIYYGSYYQESDLARVQTLLEKRWNISTDQMLKLNTVFKSVVPFKYNIESFPDYTQPHVTDPERLQRLWYYDNVGARILEEVYLQVKMNPALKSNLANIDALVIVTGAQFDALGFASGRVAVTENPMEIAWGLEGGGSVELVTDERVVDELIHEIGHTLYLNHTAVQCTGLEYRESLACCALSPSRDDVMSYCRNRRNVVGNFFNKFEACNLRILKNKIVPAMLSGGAWAIEEREVCE